MSSASVRAGARRFSAVGIVAFIVAALLTAGATSAQAVETTGVSGTVTASGGGGLGAIDVDAYQEVDGEWEWVDFVQTESDGTYVLPLAPGTYRIGFGDYENGDYVSEYYDDQTYLEDAVDVVVEDGTTTANLDADLVLGGHITGKVTKSGGAGLGQMDINIYQEIEGEWNFIGYDNTIGDPDDGIVGTYDLSGLPSGTYRLEFEDYLDGTYASEFYNNKATVEDATNVTVTAGAVTPSINAELGVGGHIKGKVTNPDNIGLADVSIGVFRKTTGGDWVTTKYGYTEDDGFYDIVGVAAGTYRIGFYDNNEIYLEEFYNNQPTVETAADVTLTVGQTQTRNIQLAEPAAPISNTEAPSISGTPKVGSTLTANKGTWTPSGLTYGYKWLANGSPIAGATAATYVPTAAVLGQAISVEVTGSKAGSASVSETSAQTAVVAEGTIANVTAPAIPGTPKVGSSLTANPGTWTPSGATFAYQWIADNVDIAGATTGTYTPVAADLGKKLSIRVTASKAGYTAQALTSVQTVPVAVGPVTNSVAPSVSGTAAVGQVLTANDGTWSPSGVTFGYQWLANNVEIGGATSKTYSVVSGDLGKKISVKVTGSKAGYSDLSKTTTQTGVVMVAIPGNLHSTAQSGTTLTLAWDAIEGATHYRIQLSKSSTMSSPIYTTYTSNSAVLTGLSKSTKYYFRVVVVDAAGVKLSDYTQTPYPSASTTSDTTWPMPTPFDLHSTAQAGTSLTLLWDAVPDAARYRIQVSKSSTMSGATYVSSTTNTVVLTGLAKSTTYYFRVAVVDAANSAKLSDYTQTPYPSASTTSDSSWPLPTPANLHSTAQTGTTLSLDWDAVEGATHYRIQLSKSSTMSGATYQTFTATDAVLAGLSKSTKYYFRVVAVNAAGVKQSDYTQTPYPSASTTSAWPLPTPANLHSTAQTDTTLSLDWDPVEGATHYRIQLSKSSTMSGATYQTFTATDAVMAGLSKSTKYYFRVVAVNAAGVKQSDYTPKVYPSATTKAWPLPTPVQLHSTDQTDTTLSLDWDAVEGATHYRIQLSKSSNMSGASYTTVSNNTAVLTGLTPSTTYYFRVVVVNAAGVKLSDYTPMPYPSESTTAATLE